MNAIFKLVVLAVMAALFAATHPESGEASVFQTAALDTNQALVHLR